MNDYTRARLLADEKWPEVQNAILRLPRGDFNELVDLLTADQFPACFREDVRGMTRDQLEVLWSLAVIGIAEWMAKPTMQTP